jgi:hypothetical protein
LLRNVHTGDGTKIDDKIRHAVCVEDQGVALVAVEIGRENARGIGRVELGPARASPENPDARTREAEDQLVPPAVVQIGGGHHRRVRGVQQRPAWVTVRESPATVTVPMRAAPGFGSTERHWVGIG